MVSLLFFPHPISPELKPLNSMQPKTLKWISASIERSPGKILWFWLRDQERGLPLLPVSEEASYFFFSFSLFLFCHATAPKQWCGSSTSNSSNSSSESWREPKTLRKGNFPLQLEEPWSMKVGQTPAALLSLVLGLNSYSHRKCRQRRNKAPDFWPKDWTRGTSVNQKV